MSSLITLIVEFLASVEQARATEELPRGEAEIKAIGDDVAAIKAELAKTAPKQPS